MAKSCFEITFISLSRLFLFFLLFFRVLACEHAFVQWIEVAVESMMFEFQFNLFSSSRFDSFDAGGINFQVICRYRNVLSIIQHGYLVEVETINSK